MAYANGLIPLTAMRQLSTGGYLLANAAGAFEVWRIQAAAAGFDMRPTSNSDAFRSLAVQEALFFARYSRTDYGRRTNGAVKVYQGVVYYLKPGFAVAATPGSSNHGKGLAVDIRNAGAFGGAYHNWMSRTGPALGFNNIEGRSINEPWHWVHSGAFTVSNPIGGGGAVTIPKPGGGTIAPPAKETFLMALTDEQQQNLYDAIVGTNGSARMKTLMPFGQNLPTSLAETRGAIQELLNRTAPVNRGEQVSLRQEIADTKTMLVAALPQLLAKEGAPVDVPALAAALKDSLGSAVADELANRLKG